MDQQSTATSPASGTSTPHELFALTDEQILDIEPEPQGDLAQGVATAGTVAQGESSSPADVSSGTIASQENDRGAGAPRYNSAANPSPAEHGTRDTGRDTEPPAWLAAQMNDPRSGAEANEFWNGVQQAKQEAAAYRAAFATPEDARALKELYPGGVNEARAAANRARLLDQIDSAYFGAAGSSQEQTSAARTQLAALMLREDPGAFREMVFAGLRALEEAEKGSGVLAATPNLPRLAQVISSKRAGVDVAPPFRAASSPASLGGRGAAPPDPSVAQGESASPALLSSRAPAFQENDRGAAAARYTTAHESPVTSLPAQAGHQSLSAYAVFEKAANEDLERSVGAAISRTIEQALPNVTHAANDSAVGAQHAAPLQARLTAAVRQDVEAALKGDRQLGEQIAQILSARRFDTETRAQVVRLIDDRARQLVPSAAKRVLNDWTHATLAAHRGSAARAEVASTRREVEPVVARGPVAQGESASPAALPSAASRTVLSSRREDKTREASPRATSRSHRVDYRKLSDEQILDL